MSSCAWSPLFCFGFLVPKLTQTQQKTGWDCCLWKDSWKAMIQQKLRRHVTKRALSLLSLDRTAIFSWRGLFSATTTETWHHYNSEWEISDSVRRQKTEMDVSLSCRSSSHTKRKVKSELSFLDCWGWVSGMACPCWCRFPSFQTQQKLKTQKKSTAFANPQRTQTGDNHNHFEKKRMCTNPLSKLEEKASCSPPNLLDRYIKVNLGVFLLVRLETPGQTSLEQLGNRTVDGKIC